MAVRYGLALSLLALGACVPAAQEPDDERLSAQESPTAAAPVTPTSAPTPPKAPAADALPDSELPGEYRVAGVDGGDIDLPHAITASIRNGRILVTADCVQSAWRYDYDNGGLTTTLDPVVACDRGRYPAEEAVFAAFEAADRVSRTPANGIRFSGGGRSVTLFSQ